MFDACQANKTNAEQYTAQHILIVIASMDAGGAERVISVLANAWAEAGKEITLLTLDDGKKSFYELAPSIKMIGIGLMTNSSGLFQALSMNIKRLHELRKIITHHQPDIVLSYIDQTNVLTLLATIGLSMPVIVSERIDPAQHKIGWIWNWLRHITYPWAHRIVVQTSAASAYFPEIMRKSIDIVPNPVVFERNENRALQTEKVVLGMGRLDSQKGFDLLLQAFAGVTTEFPDWKLIIYGEGSQRNYLEQLRDQLDLREYVQFRGVTDRPLDVMRDASIFVLSSRYEGFPNVLLDAMACSLPVISFDCPSGPAAIIHHDVDGILVPNGDIDALSHELRRLMKDPGERERLAKKAKDNVKRFSLEKVMQAWEQVMISAVRSTVPKRPRIAEIFYNSPCHSDNLADIYEQNFFNNIRLSNGVFKTTSSRRLDDINECALPFLSKVRPLRMMDVAVSSGISTLEWSQVLRDAGIAHEMMAGDAVLDAVLYRVGRWFSVLMDGRGEPLQFDIFHLALPNTPGARSLHLLYRACRWLWLKAEPLVKWWTRPGGAFLKRQRLALVSPRVCTSSIQLVQDDLYLDNPSRFAGCFHAVRAANILNRDYFPEAILMKMAGNLRKRLVDNGLLIVCRTIGDGSNHGSIFRCSAGGSIVLLRRIGEGSEVESLILSQHE
jgi:Glycosyltransferase